MPVQFDTAFKELTDYGPFPWQRCLFTRMVAGDLPSACDIPTGLGKTSVMAIWLIALALADEDARKKIPRRLVYVVDRRAVVDQATAEAEKLRARLNKCENLKGSLALQGDLPISTLRGQHVDNRAWLVDPTVPAIVVGTVDMIGSRVLFSGYGVGRKMRPYHAGFLGADTLVALDEAHLVPPFERLLESIESGADAFGPRGPADRQLIPPFRLLSLSATGRERSGEVLRLTASDLDDCTVRKRLDAKKNIRLRETGERKLQDALAEEAWALVESGTSASRVIVYCDSREIAKGTKDALDLLAKRHKRTDAVETELFVGARRVREREEASLSLVALGFIAGSPPAVGKAMFLVATSAGEVGVDLDADHMVCDLVPWERMVQRLGRVNRRGGREAQVAIVHGVEPKPKKAGEPTAEELRSIIAHNSLNVLAELGAHASPGALNNLRSRAAADPRLREKIKTATTPEPLRPALTRPLADAWAMTSLEDHPGRPDIQPWVRGWIDEQPQTTIIWRKHLPVVVRDGDPTMGGKPDQDQIAIIGAFFEAAPPETSETLETESWRVADWLIARATAVKKRAGKSDGAGPPDIDIGAPTVMALRGSGEFLKWWSVFRLAALDDKENKREKERFLRELGGITIVVLSELGGLTLDGLLDEKEDREAVTIEAVDEWSPSPSFRVRDTRDRAPIEDETWREATRFAVEMTADEESRWLAVDQKIERAEMEDGRAVSLNAQVLDEHQEWAEREARRIAARLGLPSRYADMLALAARLHDEGKKAKRWQRAFNAPRNGRLYAKTKGPINQKLLDGYRHEFGSLGAIETNPDFVRLPEDLKDLLLHLVAAHHGGARPVISPRSCEDAPPSALEGRARDVALRFARMQKHWGPWGLAWWESLLRASDQAASRVNDERRATRAGSNGTPDGSENAQATMSTPGEPA